MAVTKPIVIAAGHDNKAQGAEGQGVTEHQIVTAFRNDLAKALRDAGYPVVTDGEGQTNLPLSQSVELAKQGRIAIEIHCNSFTSPAATGVETLSDGRNKRLGFALCDAIASATGIRNRGAKDGNAGQHASLAYVRAGGLVLELFFLSNKQDFDAFMSNRAKVVQSVANVIQGEYDVRKNQ